MKTKKSSNKWRDELDYLPGNIMSGKPIFLAMAVDGVMRWGFSSRTCFKSPCSNFKHTQRPCPLCSFCVTSLDVKIFLNRLSKKSLSLHLKKYITKCTINYKNLR